MCGLETSLSEALDGMKPEYQCKLAHLLETASNMGAYDTEDCGELAVITKSGKIVMRESEAAPLYQYSKNPYSLHDFDECECGDYKHQHELRIGRCNLSWTHKHEGVCNSFRLFKMATEIPEVHKEYEQIAPPMRIAGEITNGIPK